MLTKVIFEPGDVVHLRSGSFPMTISALNEDGTVANVRWDENDTLQRDSIPVAALISAEEINQDVEEFNETPKKKKKKRKK